MSPVELVILDERLRAWGLPTYQSPMAAAIDLHACIDEPLELHPGRAPLLISCGFAIHMADPGMAALILPRSGLGHAQGLVLGNLVGLIDPDYTGPIMASAWNRNGPGTAPITIAPGQRFAQMLFVPVLRPSFVTVERFGESSRRGSGGFGSTGARPGQPGPSSQE
ncbi:MAG: dUTP diphosphatase [Acetobacteraceae bacterium]|nr:dUTP diphosphatase [Acetobacteraceae bacterium]